MAPKICNVLLIAVFLMLPLVHTATPADQSPPDARTGENPTPAVPSETSLPESSPPSEKNEEKSEKADLEDKDPVVEEGEPKEFSSTMETMSTEIPSSLEPDTGKRKPKKRINCTAPAIEQFPRPLMGPSARRHGGLIIHVLVAIFTFLGLAIVCDHYFVSSLDRICEELKMSPDVAGATFMAVGSSAPELATVVIGVFLAEDDIGISGVIGSAVFNIMFVISVCALCTATVSRLNWWPLVRDCFFYAVAILVMLATLANGYISWPESLVMLFMYVVYCVALHFNSRLERWAHSLNLPFKLPPKEEQNALVTYKNVPAQNGAIPDVTDQKQPPTESSYLDMSPTRGQKGYNTSTGAGSGYENEGYYNDPLASGWDTSAPIRDARTATTAGGWDSGPVWDPNSMWEGQQQGAPPPSQPKQVQAQVGSTPQTPASQTQPTQLVIQAASQPQNYYKPKEYNPDDIKNPLEKPLDAGKWGMFCWYIVYPIHFACRATMPDCRSQKYRNWYPFTFLISMLWISFYSYFMVWMITIIGSTLGIPDTVMGLTFVAAGVSVPDALSSIAVIKEGYGDMAVSNAVGSNVFDILVCLGLPWFIKTAIVEPGSYVRVISKGLAYSTLSLLSTVVFLVLATHMNGWQLDRKYGIILMGWYLFFITFASLYELNVFGYWNPLECISEY